MEDFGSKNNGAPFDQLGPHKVVKTNYEANDEAEKITLNLIAQGMLKLFDKFNIKYVSGDIFLLVESRLINNEIHHIQFGSKDSFLVKNKFREFTISFYRPRDDSIMQVPYLNLEYIKYSGDRVFGFFDLSTVSGVGKNS